jgi:WD40 repeat protein
VTLSDDGQHVLAGMNDGTIVLWEVDSGAVLRSFESPRPYVDCVRFSPDGERLLSVTHGVACVRERGTGRELAVWTLRPKEAIGFAEWVQGASKFITCTRDGALAVWDLARAQRVADLEASPAGMTVAGFACPADGSSAFICGDGRVYKRDMSSGKVREILLEGDLNLPVTSVFTADVSRDGIMLCTGHLDGSLRFWGRQGQAPTSLTGKWRERINR